MLIIVKYNKHFDPESCETVLFIWKTSHVRFFKQREQLLNYQSISVHPIALMYFVRHKWYTVNFRLRFNFVCLPKYPVGTDIGAIANLHNYLGTHQSSPEYLWLFLICRFFKNTFLMYKCWEDGAKNLMVPGPSSLPPQAFITSSPLYYRSHHWGKST